MRAFTRHTGTAVAIDLANIDTDQIIPKQYLKTVSREGLGQYLFDSWRYSDEGYPEKPLQSRQPIADFVLNQSDYANASICVAGRNFGCGSSREHAVWAILDYGIQVVIAPSFADIFFRNSIKNGLLPVCLEQQQVQEIIHTIQQNPAMEYCVSLETNRIESDDNSYSFQLDETYRQRLLKGLDAIGVTLEQTEKIKQFEQQHQKNYPWLFTTIHK